MSGQTAGFGAPFGHRAARGARLLSAPAFDWIYITLILLAEVGFTLDVLSHVLYGPDQSVLSAYHLLMYGSMAMLGAYLAYAGATRMREGASWRNALPAGYGLGFVGVMIFGISGGLDLIGHALFGFETGTEAILSPTHTGLFLGFALIRLALPLAAGARQHAGIRQSWVDYVPAMIAIALLFQLFTFLAPNTPLEGQGADWATQALRGVGDTVAYTVGIGGILLLTVLYVGLMIGALRVVRLPVGSITGITVLFMLLTNAPSLLSGGLDLTFVPVWLAAGIVGDLWLLVGRQWIKNEVWTLRLFGLVVPLVLWGAYFATLFLTNAGGGVWWSFYMWTGAVGQAVLTGFMIAVLATLPALTPAEGETR